MTLPESVHRVTNPEDPDSQRAWELYCSRGVIVPGFAGEIAERRRVLREWDGDGGLR